MSTILFLILGALIHSLGSLWYVRETLRGNTQPNRMTFFMWAASAFIGFAASLAAGGGWALLPVFMAGFFPFLIFVASFVNPKAYWKLGVLDYACGILSVLALVLWVMTKEPVVAVVFAILADALASFPTLLKAWRHPETETGTGYFAAFINASIGFAVLTTYTFSHAAFLIYLIVIDILLVIAVYRKRALALFEPKG